MSAPEEVPELAAVPELLARLLVSARTVASHGAVHPAAEQAAERLVAALDAARPPFTLRLVGDGVFRDGVLVPLDVESFPRARQLAAALDAVSVGEITFDGRLSHDSALHLARVLAAAGERRDETGTGPAGVRFRRTPHVQRGSLDPEMTAVARATLAITTAEQIASRASPAWPWAAGIAVVRHLEAALAAQASAATRTVELAPTDWGPARQGVSGALLALATLGRLGVSRGTMRAAAHATLGLVIQGMRPRDGIPLAAAADTLVTRMVASTVDARAGLPPHRLQTIAVVHLLTPVGHARKILRLRVVRLVELLYELERMRRPVDVTFDLTRTDVLAQAARRVGTDFDEVWFCSVIATVGEVPPGTCVQLPEGYLGVAIGPSATCDPWLPEVLVDGTPIVASGPVRLVAPHVRILRATGDG